MGREQAAEAVEAAEAADVEEKISKRQRKGFNMEEEAAGAAEAVEAAGRRMGGSGEMSWRGWQRMRRRHRWRR